MTSSFNSNNVNRIIEEDAPSLMPNGSIVAEKMNAAGIPDGYSLSALNGVGVWAAVAGSPITVSDTEPENPSEGDLWIDTSGI